MKSVFGISVRFYKMHGLGNDYVYIVCEDKKLPANPGFMARAIADRHCGVGGDGMVVVGHSDRADLSMRMWNADGSEAQMCGNASRCVGLLAYMLKMVSSADFTLDTKAGVKRLHLNITDGEVQSVTVDMGEPLLTPEAVPVNMPSAPGEVMSQQIECCGQSVEITAVGMGNPHGVVFLDHAPGDFEVLTLGPELERHPVWPQKANIEFAHCLSPELVEMRVWERGTGETMACGTGACATAVAAVLRGLAERHLTIRLRGGDLKIEWRSSDNHLLMTGPASLVASGRFYFDSIAANPFMKKI